VSDTTPADNSSPKAYTSPTAWLRFLIPATIGLALDLWVKAYSFPSVFLAFGLVALAVILWVFAGSGAKQRVVHIALGMITAGALGNLYDRAMFHGVRDMLRFYVDWYPYIFNVADVLLCVGVPLLIVRWMFVKDDVPLKPGQGFEVVEGK
jgi:lipoprotein signal peptidase